MTVATKPNAPLDAVIVGAGFAGLYMLHRLRGQGMQARVLEQGHGVGGTWYWNRYPGARCDVESMEYSYQFDDALQQEWNWTERYAGQPEILRYANHVAERYDLTRDIQFDTRVVSAHWNERDATWTVTTGADERFRARFVILATGCLSMPNAPRIEGLDSFAGRTLHTARWPHEPVDFKGRRVGVIGTGSSAIQSIPIIAEAAAHLTVFQRTPNYSIPAHNGPLDPARAQAVKANYKQLRATAKTMRNGILMQPNMVKALEVSAEERQRQYDARWRTGGLMFNGAFMDTLLDQRANDAAAEYVRGKISSIVKDQKTAATLSPHTTIACKRLCVDTGYYDTYNRPNVTLIDVAKNKIERVTAEGVIVAGTLHALDDLVLATGFDAMTGAIGAIDIRGRDGAALKDKWSAGPRTYLGLMSAGFPNLFTITGPGSPSVLTNMLPTIEHHVEMIADAMAHLRGRKLATLEPEMAAEEQWVAHVNEIAGGTLFPTCNSWYLGANVPGKPRVFMPYVGFPAYVAECSAIVTDGYRGFMLG